MKNSEIKDLGTKEINDRLKEETVNFTKQKLNHAVSQLDNPHKITETRRFIARLKTELRKRELDAKV
jgi:large subunit ribosomal protein L29